MTPVIKNERQRGSTWRQAQIILGCVRQLVEAGEEQGRKGLVLKLLALRFGNLDETVEDTILSAQDKQVDAVAEKMSTAETLEEALLPLA
jgi:hypothetical protein